MTKVFVSYSHQQGEWVWDRLVPCLRAGGAEVLIDKERFAAGKAVIGQMDATQDQAARHILVLSQDYLHSDFCKHEMNRAIKCDPKFQCGIVIPVLREACTLPAKIKCRHEPLYVDLQDDKKSDPWQLLFKQCGADLGTTAPDWLAARDSVIRLLGRGQSVNLVVQGQPKWRELLTHVVEDHYTDLALVNLEHPDTTSRRGLLASISQALGIRTPIPETPYDLKGFNEIIAARPHQTRVALSHFDLAPYRPYYDIDLFASLRYSIMEARSLVLLVESRSPFSTLLPGNHPLSTIDIKTIELGRLA